ncbi:LEPR-XLL domain-containing protein [Pseudomonas guariconensis]|uniref:LEPR-XLL domain-containing protein n=1 Tax=Pseudomonas TaxID=286 RepID=UPI00143AA255|nr:MULTISPECIES: LEPR-XLL domain-containing protein [Pseudomonas]MDD2089833.1 LEPR-XLL domain-containing protein [Pseudomonas guariconensis]
MGHNAKVFRPQSQTLALEPRILFDGAAASAAADQHHQDTGDAAQADAHPSTPDQCTAAGPTSTVPKTLVVLDNDGISQLPQQPLASRHGGPLEVVGEGEARVPSSPLFHLLVQLDTAPPSLRETRGHLQIEGQRRSLLAEGLMHLAAVFMRESGF